MMFVFIVLCFLFYISSVGHSLFVYHKSDVFYVLFLFSSHCFPFNFSSIFVALFFTRYYWMSSQARSFHWNVKWTCYRRRKKQQKQQTFKNQKLWNGAKCTSRWVLVTYYYRYITLTLNTVTINALENVLFSHLFHLKYKTKPGRILCGAPWFKRHFICSFESVWCAV